jgi:hypothetical protein
LARICEISTKSRVQIIASQSSATSNASFATGDLTSVVSRSTWPRLTNVERKPSPMSNLRASRSAPELSKSRKRTAKVIPINRDHSSILPPSPLPSADSRNYAARLRSNMTYLRACLPENSDALFTPRRYGNHLGVPCTCPHCDERPPREIRPWNRWRWLTFHIATRHTK